MVFILEETGNVSLFAVQCSPECWGCTPFLVTIPREARCSVWVTGMLLPPSSLETPHHPGMLHFRRAVGLCPGHREEYAGRTNGYCCSGNNFGRRKVGSNRFSSLLHGHFWFHSVIVHNTSPPCWHSRADCQKL